MQVHTFCLYFGDQNSCAEASSTQQASTLTVPFPSEMKAVLFSSHRSLMQHHPLAHPPHSTTHSETARAPDLLQEPTAQHHAYVKLAAAALAACLDASAVLSWPLQSCVGAFRRLHDHLEAHASSLHIVNKSLQQRHRPAKRVALDGFESSNSIDSLCSHKHELPDPVLHVTESRTINPPHCSRNAATRGKQWMCSFAEGVERLA
jgi:hypothetical protein